MSGCDAYKMKIVIPIRHCSTRVNVAASRMRRHGMGLDLRRAFAVTASSIWFAPPENILEIYRIKRQRIRVRSHRRYTMRQFSAAVPILVPDSISCFCITLSLNRAECPVSPHLCISRPQFETLILRLLLQADIDQGQSSYDARQVDRLAAEFILGTLQAGGAPPFRKSDSGASGCTLRGRLRLPGSSVCRIIGHLLRRKQNFGRQ